ncbi:MAG: alpha-amylase family glycosyl hydrolase [Phycisphaerales bacterium JB040]
MIFFKPALFLACSLGASGALGADADNNVEWNGLSHVVHHDLRPLVPLSGDDVVVEFQAYRGDLTAANVLRTVNGGTTSHAASIVGQRGPYDLWRATLPGTTQNQLAYVIEAIDGTDTDYLGARADRPHEWAVSDNAPASPFLLDFTTLSHARNGATPTSSGVVFKVWAPTSATAHVRGQFNSWSTTPMAKHGEHFVAHVPNASPGQMYKFYFNNSVWNTDPHAALLNESDNTNAVIQDPLAYEWRHDGFTAVPRDRMVIYQLHVGSFSGLNDPLGPAPTPSRYYDVALRADHLAELGVNAVMVNPINMFPGDFSGGYNPTSMFAWEGKLGTPDQLKFMVDELHERGIAVILDVVWNHFDSGANFLWNYNGSQLYFDSPAQDTPWGAQADFDAAGVYDYFLDSVHHVLGEFRMDGYRQDAVMYMTDSALTGQWGVGQDLVRDMNDLIDRRYADGLAIAEMYIDSSWVTNPNFGIAFDAQYHNEFKEAVRSATFGAAFGSPDVSRVAGVMDGQGPGVEGSFVMNYFELHDDAWPLNGHERAVKQIDTTFPHDDQYARGRTTLAHGLVLTSRGIPAILYGSEWLESNGFESKIDWSRRGANDGTFEYFKDLIALRTTEPSLFADAPMRVSHLSEGNDVFAMHRWSDDGRDVVVVANYSDTDWGAYDLGLPQPGQWDVLVDSQFSAYDGSGYADAQTGVTASGPARDGFAQSATLRIPARSLLVMAPPTADPCPGDVNGDGVLDNGDIGAFVQLFLAGDPASDFNGDGVLDNGDIGAFVTVFLAGC